MTARQKLLLAIPLVVVLVAGVALWVINTGSDSNASDAIIEAKIPAPNSKVVAQQEVGIDLLSGWDAQLTLDGKVIPDDQVKKNLPQSMITFTPGARRRRSPTVRAPEVSMVSRSITVTEPVAEDRGRAWTVAVS